MLRIVQFFDPGEYTFETYKADVPCKQFIQWSTLQQFVTICVYHSEVAFSWSKSRLILKPLILSVTAAKLFQNIVLHNQTCLFNNMKLVLEVKKKT